jgi:hypothetical protein
MNKKLIGFALLLTLAASLGACQNSETPDGTTSPGSSPAESPSPAAS